MYSSHCFRRQGSIKLGARCVSAINFAELLYESIQTYRINRAEATVEVFEILASQACSPVDLCFQGPLGGFDTRCQGGPFEYYRSLRKDLVSSVTYHSVASTLGCRPCQTGGRQMRLIYAPGPESSMSSALFSPSLLFKHQLSSSVSPSFPRFIS